MKKSITIILLASLSATVQAQQPQQVLNQLEDYLQLQGFNIRHVQSNTNGSITHRWEGMLTTGTRSVPVLYDHGVLREGMSEDTRQHIIHRLDSIQAVRLQQMSKALDSIRITFADLAKQASESYMYEYHKNGYDTIKYSIDFGQDSVARYSSHYRMISSIYNHCVANFRYWKNYNDRNQCFEEIANYYRALSIPSQVYDLQPFDLNALEALIQPSLKQLKKLKGAKTFPVYWRHDEGFNDNIVTGNLLSKTIHESDYGDNKHTGLTTGTHYFLPSDYEAEAEALCQHLDSLAHDYVNKHPEQVYHYYFISHFPFGNLKDIVQGHNYRDHIGYNLSCMRDGDGFHILSIITKGELWIPRDWPKLKSYINGEKTYLKGMKPKE